MKQWSVLRQKACSVKQFPFAVYKYQESCILFLIKLLVVFQWYYSLSRISYNKKPRCRCSTFLCNQLNTVQVPTLVCFSWHMQPRQGQQTEYGHLTDGAFSAFQLQIFLIKTNPLATHFFFHYHVLRRMIIRHFLSQTFILFQNS